MKKLLLIPLFFISMTAFAQLNPLNPPEYTSKSSQDVVNSDGTVTRTIAIVYSPQQYQWEQQAIQAQADSISNQITAQQAQLSTIQSQLSTETSNMDASQADVAKNVQLNAVQVNAQVGN